MRCAFFGAAVIVTLAMTGPVEGRAKKKLPALAFDATVVKLEEKKGVPTKIYYETLPEDKKKLGIGHADSRITKGTKFIFVGPAGDKTVTQKAALADAEMKEYLQKDKKIRVQVTATQAEEIRFGPELKARPPKRVR
jgi:hypothetical protein